ncbi:MAG: neutral/alkaline ceramidase [Candidatus Methylomirabilales bacterium]
MRVNIKRFSFTAILLSASTIHVAGATVTPMAASGPCANSNTFLIGSGIYDITGPAAELGMMGYARLGQKTAGIHTRLWSRAFVIASPCNNNRVVLVTADLGILSQAVAQGVVEQLEHTFGDLYTDQNVLLSATHTHSGPGGYSHYALYNLTIFGFDRQNFRTVVDGIYQSIVRAHDNLAEGTITMATGELLDASINRSPVAYAQNPAAELAVHPFDTDKVMTLLKLEKLHGREIGSINWFPVHATSMGNDNTLISGDNKGYAAYLFEKRKATDYTAGETFVAAFAQSNEGDVSPNIFGGTDGGGATDFESTQISGQQQFAKALELYNGATELLTGGVDSRHTYLTMDEVSVAPAFTGGVDRRTCPAAIGISMLAGAEEGPGFGEEGWTCQEIEDFFGAFTCAGLTTACQGEKPIALETGTQEPFPWTPEVLPFHIITIGKLALVGVPFEMTTMAGRRLRRTVEAQLAPAGIDTVVIAGLANAYAGYVATREGYSVQHYEGASTHFGPWTLAALQQEFDRLASALREGFDVDPGPTPRDLRCCQHTVLTGVVFDDKPLFKRFGSVHKHAKRSYTRGETVTVIFWGGHPRNNLKIQDTYLEVQRRMKRSWVTVATDLDWETKYRWQRVPCPPTFACSYVTVEWEIPEGAAGGSYRIRHYGHWKSGWNASIHPYTGTSRIFTVQ